MIRENLNFDEIDFEDYQEEIEKINKMADELWQNESIRKAYVRQSIDDLEEDFKEIKEYYVELAQQYQSNWNDLRKWIEEEKQYNREICIRVLNKMSELEERNDYNEMGR